MIGNFISLWRWQRWRDWVLGCRRKLACTIVWCFIPFSCTSCKGLHPLALPVTLKHKRGICLREKLSRFKGVFFSLLGVFLEYCWYLRGEWVVYFVGFLIGLRKGEFNLNDEYNSLSRRSSEPSGTVDNKHGIKSLTVPLCFCAVLVILHAKYGIEFFRECHAFLPYWVVTATGRKEMSWDDWPKDVSKIFETWIATLWQFVEN